MTNLSDNTAVAQLIAESGGRLMRGDDSRLPHRLALTYREAADTLGLCERTVWELVHDGRLKACRIGRAVRISVAEIERFLTAPQ